MHEHVISSQGHNGMHMLPFVHSWKRPMQPLLIWKCVRRFLTHYLLYIERKGVLWLEHKMLLYSHPLLRVLPHPEIRHSVPAATHLEGKEMARMRELSVAGVASLMSIMSLSMSLGLKPGWGICFSESMNSSVPSRTSMLCSPSLTWMRPLRNGQQSTLLITVVNLQEAVQLCLLSNIII